MSRAPVGTIVMLGLLLGCDQEMAHQAKLEPLEASPFFGDGRASRAPVEGTVARGRLETDSHRFSGRKGKEFAATFPFALTPADLRRGRERYRIFCAVCHDAAGTGQGMIVQRGFKAPPSIHEERLRQAPPGQMFDVITNGIGSMAEFRNQISPDDRWRIVAYLRALQLSRATPASLLSEEDLRRLGGRP